MKTLRKALCLLMALLMVFSCGGALIASAAEKDYDHYPLIYVTGVGSANIYYEDDPDKSPLLYPIDTKRLLGNLTHVGSYILDSIAEGNPDLLYSCLYSYLWESFGMLRLNPDGSSVDGVVVEPMALNYVGNGQYDFKYDSRLNPIDIAPQLHEYIQLVKEDSGADKVEIVGSSLGSTVVTAYLDLYADDLSNIDSVILSVPTVKGVGVFGELLSGRFDIDPVALKYFVKDTLNLKGTSDFLTLLNYTGILDILLDAMFVPMLREAIYDALLDFCRDALAKVPAIWTTIDSEHLDSALLTLFGENYNEPDHPYAAFIAQARFYNENVMNRAEEIYLTAVEKNPGLHFSVICKYGSAPLPFSAEASKMEDGLVTIESSSFGATCALHGQQLEDGYVQARYPEHNFLSADGCIDASTCVFPYNTWFLKGLGHAQKNEDYWNLVTKIAYENIDVLSDPSTPQFLVVSTEDPERLVPLQSEEDEEETLLGRLFSFILRPVYALVDFFKRLFRK